MRLFSLALALAVLSPLAAAQDGVCTGGLATFAGTAYPCDGIDVLGVVPGGPAGPLGTTKVNDVWGWTDTDGAEYALVGTTNGTVFVDVTVPTAPRVLGKLTASGAASTWRDIKVFQSHAFVVSEASGHGMQVFDLTRLRGLAQDAARTFTADARYTGAGKAHNIAIDEASARAYLVGANQGGSACNGGGLHIVDISTPTQPAFAGCYDGDGYTHDAQCLVYDGPDADYAGRQICFASNTDTLTIVDVTDAAAPVEISKGFYANPSYTHQNWLSEDGRYVYVDDELDSSAGGARTIVLDVADLDNPEFAFFHLSTEPTIDHNHYVRGDYLFQSHNEAGLRVLDTSGVAGGALTEVRFFDTYPASNDEAFNGSWSNYPYFASGTLLVTDRTGGLFTLRAEGLFPTAGQAAPDARAVLSAPSPNPTTGVAELSLTADAPQFASVALYDTTGRRVAALFDGPLRAGEAVGVRVDAASLPTGVYLVRARGETFELSRAVTVAR